MQLQRIEFVKMCIKSCILCGLILFYAAYAAPASYLITLRNFAQTQCPLYESLLMKSPFLDQCSDKRPLHLGWKDRNVILCLMYSNVFKHFCKTTNLISVYESAGRNLTKEFQEASLELSHQPVKVCNSLQNISTSVLTADVVKIFNDSTKCKWLCSNFDTDLVVDICSLTSVMWELTEKNIAKGTTVGKVLQQETTNPSEKNSSPAVTSKSSTNTSINTEVNQDKPSIEADINKNKASVEADITKASIEVDVDKNKASIDTDVNKNKASINADVNENKPSIDADVDHNKVSVDTDVNQQHSSKESAIETKTDHAHKTNGDKPTIVDQVEDHSKGSIKLSQPSDDSTLSKDVVTSKDKKNSQKVTAHGNSGPETATEDAKSLPVKPNLSDTKNVEVPINSVITGEASDHNKDFNENMEPKTKSDAKVIPKNQKQNNLDIANVDSKVNPKDTPVESKEKVIPGVKNQSNTTQVVPQNEHKKIEDSPDTKADDINLEGDIDDEDLKYEGEDNEEPPLLQKPTKGKGDNAEEEDGELAPPKYGEVKNKVDVVKPKEIDEDNVNIAANYQNQNIDDSDSYFFSYFMMVCVVFIFGYVAYHNKQKILALVLEGRRGRRSSRTRRPNSSNYRKLDSTLEEAVTSSCNKNSTQVIY